MINDARQLTGQGKVNFVEKKGCVVNQRRENTHSGDDATESP